ncbi:MAG TPA: CPBP family intramembrane glutamic endopeptidase [Limnochordales bacterium]
MFLRETIVSTLLQAAVMAGIPCLLYFTYHRWRFGRGGREVAVRLGLCVGEPRYVYYSLAIAAAAVLVLVVSGARLPAGESLAQQQFAGRGVNGEALIAALFYGAFQTGFTEELLFRGLITGSLARRLPATWANLVQALVFSLPHLPIVFVSPGLWGLLVAVLAAALLLGWLRIRSGSILGPWLVHAAVNVAVALIAASQPAP